MRCEAARALGELQAAQAVESLLTALGGESWYVRRAAAEALGEIGDRRAVEPLLSALKESDGGVRQAAAWALGQIGDARAVQPLAAALKESDGGVRQAAAEALAQIDEKDSQAVAAWVRAWQQEHGIEAMVTDDLAMYQQVAQKLGLKHQLCQFHVRRWAGRALRRLPAELPQEWQPMLARIRELLTALPRDGGQVLYRLWEQIPGRTSLPDEKRTPVEKLRALILRLLTRNESGVILEMSEPIGDYIVVRRRTIRGRVWLMEGSPCLRTHTLLGPFFWPVWADLCRWSGFCSLGLCRFCAAGPGGCQLSLSELRFFLSLYVWVHGVILWREHLLLQAVSHSYAAAGSYLDEDADFSHSNQAPYAYTDAYAHADPAADSPSQW